MILLGGLATLSGPIIGALAFTAIGEVAQLITERKLLVEGLVILLVVLTLPKGLSGIAAPRWPPPWLPRRPPPSRPPSEASRHA
jgi:branched-chain amino acid transport system permease protein